MPEMWRENEAKASKVAGWPKRIQVPVVQEEIYRGREARRVKASGIGGHMGLLIAITAIITVVSIAKAGSDIYSVGWPIIAFLGNIALFAEIIISMGGIR